MHSALMGACYVELMQCVCTEKKNMYFTNTCHSLVTMPSEDDWKEGGREGVGGGRGWEEGGRGGRREGGMGGGREEVGGGREGEGREEESCGGHVLLSLISTPICSEAWLSCST